MKRNLGIRIAAFAGLLPVGLAIAVGGAWGALALVHGLPETSGMRLVLAALFAIASIATIIALCVRRWRWRGMAAYVVLFAALLVWFRGIEPSNERDWQVDVAKTSSATIEGDIVTVRNIRNFDYRSETDYTPAWQEKRYDLRELEGVDLVAVYWMGPHIAHVFVSFAFRGGDHLAISIETRKEKGEAYSTVKGFFRRYELYYVVADERDVIRLRTNYRKDPPEDVYIYRVQGAPENARRFFINYMEKINALAATPEFYNTLTTNCTTNIWLHSKVNAEHPPLSWKIFASGHVPEYLYDAGRLDSRLTFDELRRRAHANERARAADAAPDFSSRIRAADPAPASGAPAVTPAKAKGS